MTPNRPEAGKNMNDKLKPGHCHKCGLQLSDNPHPEAGKPPHYLQVGCPKECIPCLTLSRHQWAGRAMKAENELADARALLSASKPVAAEGWKLVPVEPTDDMEAAAEDDYEQTGATFPQWKSAYRAMLAASPATPPQSPDGRTIDKAMVKRLAVQYGLIDAAPAQSAEPVAIWRMVRANLNLIANSFANCKGSAATMQDLAKDCLMKVDAYLDAAPQPSPTAVVLDDERAAFEAWYVLDVPENRLDFFKRELAEQIGAESGPGFSAWTAWQARAASPQPVAQTERALTCCRMGCDKPSVCERLGECRIKAAAQPASGGNHG